MPFFPDDYVQYVLKDIENNAATRRVKRAGLIERCTVRMCDPVKLHANPNDEFSHPEVGPNFEIIADYVEEIKNAYVHSKDVFDEPIIVEKLEEEGYQILNGHHRWFAARRMHVKKVVIQIVNLVHEDDMSMMIHGTDNYRRVVFDLQETLLAKDENDRDPVLDDLLHKRIRERLRAGATDVITKFQDAGFDVWVYTPSYNSLEYIRGIFSLYNISIDGIVNGVSDKNRTKSAETLHIKRMLEDKYRYAVNIDDESVIMIDSFSKSYEQYDLPETKDTWAERVTALLPDIEDYCDC